MSWFFKWDGWVFLDYLVLPVVASSILAGKERNIGGVSLTFQRTTTLAQRGPIWLQYQASEIPPTKVVHGLNTCCVLVKYMAKIRLLAKNELLPSR